MTKRAVCDLYNGWIYPIIVAALVLFGAVTGTEMVCMLLHALLILGAGIFSDSVKPIMLSLLTFVYHISVLHAPQYPLYSDYYTTGWRIFAFGAVILLVASSVVTFIVRRRIWRDVSFTSTPLLLPTLVFCVGLLANGLFSGEWKSGGLVFALCNAAVYLLVYIILYHGMSPRDTSHELGRYFSYVSMLSAVIIIGELAHLFLTSDKVIVGGSIMKDQVALGWGIWNLIAVSLSILIPLIFYGMQVNRYPWLYFIVGTAAYISSVLTMSRNALVFSTLIYVTCVIASCFVGKHKKAFRILTSVGVLVVLVAGVILRDKITTFLADYFERGFSDNGRFDLWRGAFSSFLDAPIFGSGFYGLDIDYAQFGFVPHMAHQTFLELLGATGIFGTACYLFYRARTVLPVVKKPNLIKSAMALSALALLLGSLLDNFIFNFYPVFYYLVSLVVICKNAEEEKRYNIPKL